MGGKGVVRKCEVVIELVIFDKVELQMVMRL